MLKWPETMFKSDFKYFKSKRPPPDLTNVLDFRNTSTLDNGELVTRTAVAWDHVDAGEEELYGLKPLTEWQCLTLPNKPGLLVLPNPFTERGQRYWTCRCVRDYTRKPQRLNVDKHGLLAKGTDWWDQALVDSKLLPRLRWATLGYHHNWDTKVYSENERSNFPADLRALTEVIARATGCRLFDPQAAIVNFYNLDSSLSGHTDHSEPNQSAPIVSLSLGQSAIFLVGGASLDEKATAMFLHSGDVLLMGGASRLAYHGIPRVLAGQSDAWGRAGDLEGGGATREDMTQVKRRKMTVVDQRLMAECGDKAFWTRYDAYLATTRINVNVRQVLTEGQKALSE